MGAYKNTSPTVAQYRRDSKGVGTVSKLRRMGLQTVRTKTKSPRDGISRKQESRCTAWPLAFGVPGWTRWGRSAAGQRMLTSCVKFTRT